MNQSTSKSTITTKQHVANSGVWMMVNSFASRLAGIAGQLILAWLLVPKEFGLIALATSMAVVVDLINQFGLSDVLVSRYRRFHLWRPAGYSISAIIGLVATGIMLLVAAGASHVYDDSNLGWMVAIISISLPIKAIGIVPFTQIRAEMQFRSIALVQSSAVLVRTATAILLAFLGFGAYSFAWARVTDSIVRTVSWILIAKPQLPTRFTLRGAKYLISDSLHGYATSLCNNLIQQCDYLILGFFVALDAVGGYFLAFTISVQAISIIAINLTAVLFPAFSSLAHSPERQIRAFIRGSKMLAFTGMPLCFLQITVAAPLIPLILEPKWHSIVPLIQIMSLGTALRCASYSWDALLKAQRRFSTAARFSAIAALIFSGMITLGSYLGGVRGCTIAAALYYATISPIQLLVAIQSQQDAIKQVVSLYLRPLTICVISFGTAWLLAMPARNAELPIVEIVIDILIGLAFYWTLSWKANSVPANDMWEIIQRIKGKFNSSHTQTRTKTT